MGVQVTIRKMILDSETAVRIMKCLKEHEPEIWEALRSEVKRNIPDEKTLLKQNPDEEKSCYNCKFYSSCGLRIDYNNTVCYEHEEIEL